MYHKSMVWDDARIFLEVARSGSLRAAARALKLSQPTVGRKLVKFETAVSTDPLFERMPDGLKLTSKGATIVPLAEQLEAAALALQRRLTVPSDVRGTVRISAGEWAAGFLSARLTDPTHALRLPTTITPEIVQSDQTANLSKRAADLAVRHGRPETGDLYVSKLGVISCAVYQSAVIKPPAGAWITYTEEQSHYVSAQWTIARAMGERNGHISFRASTLSMQLNAVRRGAGKAVIPCYLADQDNMLVRSTVKIDDLDAVHWLIVHRDLRQLPIVRIMMQRISELFKEEHALLKGDI
jgi:DNA-binding transcriptional LysR family regulator